LKEKIERFSKGDFDYQLPFIYLSEGSIDITIEAGKTHEGSFTISNSASQTMRGILCSSHRLLTFKEAKFVGSVNKIYYQFDGSNLKAGETIKGTISIITDCGEQILDFVVNTEAPYFMSPLGKIKDLFQFASLARMDWSEAKKIFRSEDFERVFLQTEEKYKSIYRNLCKSISTSQALEEFLIAIHKKSKVELNIDKVILEYQLFEESLMDKLTLTKNQWGYVEIKVSTDVEFIQFEQKFIWGDFFLGNTYPVSFVIDPKKMRYGNNYGRIWIKTVHETIMVEVRCSRRREIEQDESLARLSYKSFYKLGRSYINFRLNKIDREKYIVDSRRLIALMAEDPEEFTKGLLLTYIEIISGNMKKAEDLMRELAQQEALLKSSSILLYCGYLYLRTLIYNDETIKDEASKAIRGFYERGYPDWRLLWFLLNIDKQYEGNRSLKLAHIKEQFKGGCYSPILYYEAAVIYNEEPYLLNEINSFETQVLNFSIKNSLVTLDVAMQYTYLVNRKKHYHHMLYKGLVMLYKHFPETDILSAICSTLIKGIKKSKEFHKWYRMGVEAQLPITELYEYFMYSSNEADDELLPQSVLLYYIYNSNLNERKKAYLYANIIENKDKIEPIYRSYLKKMEVFAVKQLEAHNVSRNLSVLYNEFFSHENIDSNVAHSLPYVMYRNEISCDNPNITSVVVIHDEWEEEESAQFVDGKALVDIYTDHAKIFLVDSIGNRYLKSVDYAKAPLMKSEDFETSCMEYSNHPKLLLHLFNRFQNYRIINEKSISIRKKILSIEGLPELYYYDCLEDLAEYYYENYDDEQLEYYLSLIDIHRARPEKRIRLLEYMVRRGLYSKVQDAIQTFGYEDISINLLVKYCSGWLDNSNEDNKEEFVLDLCTYAFSKHKYDEAILKYLVRYYHGSTREMFEIWKAAIKFEVDTRKIEKRLLVQMLFTEGYVQGSFQVFNEYYKNVTNRLIVRAFLSFYAYKYVIHGWVINKELFPIMRRELNYEENDLCLIAWLKYNCKNKGLSDNDKAFIEYQIHRLVKKGTILPFFTEYSEIIKLPERIIDKCFVEYKTDPRKQVFIHYRLLNNGDSEEYITEKMPNVFMGIHLKEFVLFYHEILQYYITEEYGDDVIVTESFQLHHDTTPSEGESRHNQINLMLMTKEMNDDTTLLELMEQYVRTDYFIGQCFQPID